MRLIDFGSSVDCAGWISRRGMKKDKLPCSYLFMPAGWYRYDDCAGWYAYDVYAAALVWLVTAVPALAQNEAKGLYDLRMALKRINTTHMRGERPRVVRRPTAGRALSGGRVISEG